MNRLQAFGLLGTGLVTPYPVCEGGSLFVNADQIGAYVNAIGEGKEDTTAQDSS